MAAITISDQTSWAVSGQAFRLLLHRASMFDSADSDKLTFQRAIALDGIHLDLLDSARRDRILHALIAAACSLRTELANSRALAAQYPRFDEYLIELQALLREASTR